MDSDWLLKLDIEVKLQVQHFARQYLKVRCSKIDLYWVVALQGPLVYLHLHHRYLLFLTIVTTCCSFQVIISSTWVFAFILNIPAFLAKDVGKENNGNLCVSIWPAGWMRKAYSLSWKVVVFLSCAVMAVLYSRVVYTLWFKRDDDNPLKHQQKVNVTCRIY